MYERGDTCATEYVYRLSTVTIINKSTLIGYSSCIDNNKPYSLKQFAMIIKTQLHIINCEHLHVAWNSLKAFAGSLNFKPTISVSKC